MSRLILPMITLLLISSCLKRGSKSTPSNRSSDLQKPEAPSNLRTKSETGKITLSWDAVKEASSYNVYWANEPNLNKENATKIERVVKEEAIHDELDTSKTYYYRVASLGPGGEGPLSTEEAQARADGVKVIEPKTKTASPPSPVFRYQPTISANDSRIAYFDNDCSSPLCLKLLLKVSGEWKQLELIAANVASTQNLSSLQIFANNGGTSIVILSKSQVTLFRKSGGNWAKTTIDPGATVDSFAIDNDHSRFALLLGTAAKIYSLPSGSVEKEISGAANISLSGSGTRFVYESAAGVLNLLRNSGSSWGSTEILFSGHNPSFDDSGLKLLTVKDTDELFLYREEISGWKSEKVSDLTCCNEVANLNGSGDRAFLKDSFYLLESSSWTLKSLSQITAESYFIGKSGVRAIAIDSDQKIILYDIDTGVGETVLN